MCVWGGALFTVDLKFFFLFFEYHSLKGRGGERCGAVHQKRVYVEEEKVVYAYENPFHIYIYTQYIKNLIEFQTPCRPPTPPTLPRRRCP